MTDKAIGDLTEITSLDPDDFLVVETAGGNSRKIRKGNAALGGRTSPTLVQKATLRGDGTITLPSAPTPGNIMVLLMAGFGAVVLPTNYKPAGFGIIGAFQSDANNVVTTALRVVQSGDTGSYAMSASDNQAAVLYEFADVGGVYPMSGGAMAGFFSSAVYNIFAQPSPYNVDDIVIGAFTQDTTAPGAGTSRPAAPSTC